MDPIPNVVVSLASCAIRYCEKNFHRFISEAENFLERCHSSEVDFPFFKLMVEVTLRHKDDFFFIQVSPTSSNNEYAVISGNMYSIFRVIEKVGDSFKLIWDGQIYEINMTKQLTFFNIIINQSDVVYIEKVEHSSTQSSLIKFKDNFNFKSEQRNAMLDSSLFELNNVLLGYTIREPFFTNNIYFHFEKVFSILRDPLLPALQFRRYLDDANPEINKTLTTELQQIIWQYTSNISSLFYRFPSNKIKSIIENDVLSIEDNSLKSKTLDAVKPLLELADMYSDGIRGNAKYVFDKLLQDYLKVEIKFQDEEIMSNASVVNRQIAVSDVMSHNVLREKNKLILILIEFLEKFLPGIITDLNFTIKKLLLCLSGDGYSQLISKLREILLTGQIPSYEVRKNEMESIFLNSINGSSTCVQTFRLENLICSNSEVFDVISDFFYHKIVAIRKCAMEVYVRRAYMAYEIVSFEQSQLASGEVCVLFEFSLPTNNRQQNLTGYEMKRSNSISITNRHTCLARKSFDMNRNILPNGSVDKEDISDSELLNEDYFQSDFLAQKSIDYDTDSAISVGTFSQSEQVENDGVLDHYITKSRYSPSIHSLDKLWALPVYSSMKESGENVKASNDSLDRVSSFRHNRHSSLFCNNPPLIQVQDFSYHESLGLMIIFESLEDIEKKMASIRTLLLTRNSTMNNLDFHNYNMSSLERDCSPFYKVVLKLILRDPQLIIKYDDDVARILFYFCDKHLSFFNELRVFRITFLLQSRDKTIRYFTFRYKEHFEEDLKIRNIDPILSFQLEINRLRNFHLERLPVPNRRMYVYMGKCKEMTMSEYRMFARCIIHHKDFHSSTSNVSYMGKEAERNLLEAMDAFDMSWVDERTNLTSANHIFFYFHSILCINKMEELENVVRNIIYKHGRRLWSLRITQAELKMSVKLSNGMPIPVRLWVHNEGGKSLDICIYREEFQFKTDHKVLITCSSGKDGRYHGVPVDCFYSI